MIEFEHGAPDLGALGRAYDGAFDDPRVGEVLRRGKIIPMTATPAALGEVIERQIERWELPWTTPQSARALARRFASAMRAGRLTLGTPALTNMWEVDRPFASSAALGAADGSPNPDILLSIAEKYYALNMGAGFNLDAASDPVARLLELNAHADDVERSGRSQRYVGNMAHVSARHPRVEEFVGCKIGRNISHFNISIDFTTSELERLVSGDPDLTRLLDTMADAAWECGDPGLISIDRFNERNALGAYAPYTTTAACAEIGLAPGDSCAFVYLNLAAFVRTTAPGDIDFAALRREVALAVRVLDDLLDAGLLTLPESSARAAVGLKRRIGIGVCGYADLLLWWDLPYGSHAGLEVLRDLLSVIQYEAVMESARLAGERGPFTAFPLSSWAHGTRKTPPPTAQVSESAWTEAYALAMSGMRNSALTALPPAGRSALLLRTSPSIEPFAADPREVCQLASLRERAQEAAPQMIRHAVTIPWQQHMRVVETAEPYLDESISKTVNLPVTSTPADVRNIFVRAAARNLRAISVYRQRDA